MSDLYRELILEHWRSPRHAEPLAHPTHQATVRNHSCSDEATVELVIQNDQITDISVQVSGCALSTAAGSVLAEHVHGVSVASVKQLRVDELKQLLGNIEPSLSRETCVRIGFEALKAALNNPIPLDEKEER